MMQAQLDRELTATLYRLGSGGFNDGSRRYGSARDARLALMGAQDRQDPGVWRLSVQYLDRGVWIDCTAA